MHWLLTMSPDATILLLTGGVLLIYMELNRPGLVVPGACGLGLFLLAVARLVRLPMAKSASQACALAALLLCFSVWTRWRVLFGVAAAVALFYGFGNVTMPAPPSYVHLVVTVMCALLLGLGTSFLTTIAARARQNKGLDLT